MNIQQALQTTDWQHAANPVYPNKILCLPNCEVCGGGGYVRYDVPFGDPRFGKISTCPHLPPESSFFQNHGLTTHEIKTLNWQSIDIRENVKGAIEGMQKLFRRGCGVGYLYGGSGLAKTLLLKIVCAEWARAGKGIFHLTTQKDILDDLRVAFDDDEPQRAIRDKQEKYISYPFLAIDELTIERSTDFKVEQFFHLVNKRHEAGTERGENFLTLMTGNVSPKELDFRVSDRLTDGDNFIYKLTGESYRSKMKRGYDE